MAAATRPLTGQTIRRDGWTLPRRHQFLGALAAGLDVRRACAFVGLSRRAAYSLRRRDPGFAQDWQDALERAREANLAAFVALLPEKLLRTMSELSGECELRGAPNSPQDTVGVVRGV